ncbi:MAG: DUF58 domain-containing protein [Phycisphaerales bacterium]
MLASQVTHVPTTTEELLGPELLRRLSRLDVLSRKIFAGKLPGERRSKKRGQSVEFDDYRTYVPGDDLRHLDWNVFARMDRFFIKLFREEEDLALRLVLDCSPSMHAGEPSKLVFASRLAMAIGSIGLINLNRVSIATYGWPDEPAIVQLAPMRGRRHVERLARFILDALQRAVHIPPTADAARAPIPTATFNQAMRRIAATPAGKGVLVVISDFLERDALTPGLNALAAAGGGGAFDTTCLQVLSPDEIDPARAAPRGLVGDLRLTDVETARPAEVTISAALLKRYRERFATHQDTLERACAARNMTHLLVPTDASVETLLLSTLRKRGLFH